MLRVTMLFRWIQSGVSERLSKRDVLRAGYGAMIALLLFAAFEAYRIQGAASKKSFEIYSRYVKQEDALYRLRRTLYLGGIYARDLCLNPNRDRIESYQRQLKQVRAEAEGALSDLNQWEALQQSSTELKTTAEEYLHSLEAFGQWTQSMRLAKGYDYIQSDIVPRRNHAGELLRRWALMSKESLRESESAFDGSRQGTVLRLVLVLGFCVVLGGVIARFSLTHSESLENESARRFQEMVEAKQDLQRLSARLLEIQEDERKRLSRELHDEIGQTLTALRIEISHAQALWNSGSPSARDRLERARALTERTLRTIRNISLLLRPPLLDDLGLVPALQSETEDFTRRTGLRCDFKEEGLEDALPDIVTTCVYRVVQEALHNCEKHARASRVSLSLRRSAQSLTVEVEDDGRGFVLKPEERSTQAGRLGILGMRERASILGGSIRFDSAPGTGTRLRMQIPLPAIPIPEAVPSRKEAIA
ncbi:MAG: sensor histidine kinase [Bryobacteraceae bacterium]